MTPGNNGASTPEDDDPFGYLYADGQANGAQPPSGGYGYPNSVNRVRAVGTRQYGQQPQNAQTAPYGQVPQQQGSYSQQNAHYAAPETLPGGAQTAHHATPAGGGGRGGRGPNTKGLLIGAIAVVAAAVIGIGVAMLGGDKDKDDASDKTGTTPTQSEESKPSPSTSKAGAAKQDLPKTDAKALRLSPGMTTASDIKGAKAGGGVYVTGLNQVGAKVTWTVDGIKKADIYRLYVRYAIPGVDANATLVVNGDAQDRPVNMENFGKLPKGDWEKGWQETWSNVNLTKGTNTIEIACNEGNQCDALLDQLWIAPEKGQ
ncbi:carbohydrate-binding protein [Streptomyces qaidamensis]|uniref:Carbohydrate-binding protein n=1 Tax=Streptomyces qaidamensis TaxID=1783515 RepID=A0A143C2D7_9ACTN|nr:carbohydrate-binding protein [Streptomyces qaidamensis]AMW11249.1 carbohydrate-binding protein [Streptomyces qaidamensis]